MTVLAALADERCNIERLPEKIILTIFSYLDHKCLLQIAVVCKSWSKIIQNPILWQDVSFRAENGGIQLSDADLLVKLIPKRFTSLRRLELSTDLITPIVMRELAIKCPHLHSLTLDFSSAMQLHDFNELDAFPSRLSCLCIYLSEVIFMEGFMRKIYSFLTTIEIFHLIGTYEKFDSREEEIYEVINIHKIKSHTPNLRVINFYGVKFLEDAHIESLSTNCIHLECLCLNFCTKFKGSALKVLLQRCKKLKCLLLEKTGITDDLIKSAPWSSSNIQELDVSSTELSGATITAIFPKLPKLKYLAAANIVRLNDATLDSIMEAYDWQEIKAINLSWCQNLGESIVTKLMKRIGPNIKGLDLSGLYNLLESFWTTSLPLLKSCKILVMGIPNDCCPKIHSKIMIDQYIELIAQNCEELEELEIQWDSDIMRFSEKSSKFIDHLRVRCTKLKSFVLSEGEYYEMVKSNFERADRKFVVRAKTCYVTSILPILDNYRQLCFA